MPPSPASTRSSRTSASSTRSTTPASARLRPPAGGPVRPQRGERRAHQAPEQAQDLRHHRQSAVQRQPAERERQQQEPRIRRHRRAHQGDLHRRSTAQKTKLYDMYARFFRWASDRLDDDGIIAFITNRSFIDSRTFDGFRHERGAGSSTRSGSSTSAATCAPTRNSPAPRTTSSASRPASRSASGQAKKADRRTKHTCRIYYARRPEQESAADKLAWLASTPFPQVEFEQVVPDAKGNWINQADNDFATCCRCARRKPRRQRRRTRNGPCSSCIRWASRPTATNGCTTTIARHWRPRRHSWRSVTRSNNVNAEFDGSIKWSEP